MVTVSVEVPVPITLAGLKVALAPVGSPLTLKLLVPENPFCAVIVVV